MTVSVPSDESPPRSHSGSQQQDQTHVTVRNLRYILSFDCSSVLGFAERIGFLCQSPAS